MSRESRRIVGASSISDNDSKEQVFVRQFCNANAAYACANASVLKAERKVEVKMDEKSAIERVTEELCVETKILHSSPSLLSQLFIGLTQTP
jgi:hypothetical protein